MYKAHLMRHTCYTHTHTHGLFSLASLFFSFTKKGLAVIYADVCGSQNFMWWRFTVAELTLYLLKIT